MKLFSITFCFFLFVTGNAQVISPREIIKKSEDKLRGGEQAYTEIKMEIVRPNWSRTMQLKSWVKGTSYSMILITEPARDQGSVFLKADKQVWNFIPKFNRITKLPPAAMSQSWMATDLTNDDLVKESSKVDDFTYTLLKDTVIDDIVCFQIELIPNEGSNVIWGKIKIFVDQKDFITIRNERYDEDGDLVMILRSFNIKLMNGVKIATQLEMVPVAKVGHKTIMTIEELNVNVQFDNAFFSKQNMKRLK